MLFGVNETKGQSINVEALFKDFWATRPRRPRQGRLVAGVATGIARRYDIDPAIVRVLLVVSAIYGGAGVLLYVAGWLLLAAESDPMGPDEVSAGEALVGRGQSSVSHGFTIGLGVVAVASFFYLFNGPFGSFGGFLGLAALLAGLVVLHNGRARLGIPGAPTFPRPSTTAAGGATTGSSQTTSPDWDPLGADPGAWDLPDLNSASTATVLTPPTPEPPIPVVGQPYRRSHVAGVTFGLAFMVAAVLAVVSPYTGWLTIGHIVGIVAGILGLGMVVAAFTVRGGRGLVAPTILASIAAFVLSGPSGADGRFGNIDETPTTHVAREYAVIAGEVKLDLTHTVLSKDKPITTRVSVGAGTATVIVPANADVEVRCRTNVGTVKCLGEKEDGVNPAKQVRSPATSGQSVGTINLTVSAKTGDVKVQRG
jgi:phage shock protein PspC (stress-responsive transcriptional regulator)